MNFDIVIYNGTILTVNSDFNIISDGIICIKDGQLLEVAQRDNGIPLPVAKELIDAQRGIIMPGLVNTHTHLPMTLFRGLADDLPLLVWLNEHIFPAEGSFIHPETVELGSLLACAEMMLSGTTTCCDGYFLEDHVARAVQRCGMRAVLGQGVIDFPAPGVPDPADNIRQAVTFVENWQGLTPLITPSIFCHSPYTCSPETLQAAKNAAASKGVLFQVHVAETKEEWEHIQTEHHLTPVHYLDRLGVLDPHTVLVHAVWIDQEDIELIVQRSAVVSHNPESNMKLASGIAPVPKLLDAGICVGLGTDGCASNNNLDMFAEMDVAAKLHKVYSRNPTVLDARCVVQMATVGGARAIGLGDITGSLEVGKQADLIIIDTNQPHLVPMYHPESHIVYAATGSDVRDVIIGGRVVLRDRKVLTINVEDLLVEVQGLGKKIKNSPG